MKIGNAILNVLKKIGMFILRQIANLGRKLALIINAIYQFLAKWIGMLWEKLKTFPYKEKGYAFLAFVGNLLHNILFKFLLPKKYRNVSKRRIYEIIFKSDTPEGKKFDIVLLSLISLNIILLVVDSMLGANNTLTVSLRHGTFSYWLMKSLEWGFTIFFTFEYYLRVYCLKKPWQYALSFYGIIDFISIFPAYLSIFLPATQAFSVFRLLRLLRIFRILNMRRFLKEGKQLLNALRRSLTKIIIFMLFVFIAAVILGTIMYALEGDKNGDIASIPEGIYWAVVTITTVGYGDISPITPVGRFVSVVVMLLGYAVIAVPSGIVAGETIASFKSDTEEDFTDSDPFNIVPDDEEKKGSDDSTGQGAQSPATVEQHAPTESK